MTNSKPTLILRNISVGESVDKLILKEGVTAIEFEWGDTIWYLDGVLHREGAPAATTIEGDRYWYIKGKRHRDDGPAVEEVNGYQAWYQNGVLERYKIGEVYDLTDEQIGEILMRPMCK